MTLDDFWMLIDEINIASKGDMDQKCKLLQARLEPLDEEQLGDFITHFDRARISAYTRTLWDAAYLIHGGCSDDCFIDFRSTLISLGRKTFERAVENPDTLAELNFDDGVEDYFFEGFQYVMFEVAENNFEKIPGETQNFPDEPSGEVWSEAQKQKFIERLPKSLHPSKGVKTRPKPDRTTSDLVNHIAASDNHSTACAKSWWKFW